MIDIIRLLALLLALTGLVAMLRRLRTGTATGVRRDTTFGFISLCTAIIIGVLPGLLDVTAETPLLLASLGSLLLNMLAVVFFFRAQKGRAR